MTVLETKWLISVHSDPAVSAVTVHADAENISFNTLTTPANTATWTDHREALGGAVRGSLMGYRDS
jgi:hypothetical protein